MRFFGMALLVCGAFLGTAGLASADIYTTTSSPFPNFGADTSGPGIIITFNPDGSITTTNPYGAGNSQPYDGTDDTYVGVVNNSGSTINSIYLSGSGISGFDGDGIQSYGSPDIPGDISQSPNGDPGSGTYGTGTGYAGPGTAFSNPDLVNFSYVTVNFTPTGLPTGEQAYFSLEENVSLTGPGSFQVGGAPEPTSLVLAGICGAGFVASRLRRRKVAVAAA